MVHCAVSEMKGNLVFACIQSCTGWHLPLLVYNSARSSGGTKKKAIACASDNAIRGWCPSRGSRSLPIPASLNSSMVWTKTMCMSQILLKRLLRDLHCKSFTRYVFIIPSPSVYHEFLLVNWNDKRVIIIATSLSHVSQGGFRSPFHCHGGLQDFHWNYYYKKSKNTQLLLVCASIIARWKH